jgi:hypothetical protein
MLSRRQHRPQAGGWFRSRTVSPRVSPTRFESLEHRTLLAADVVISEFLASNNSNLADNYGAYSDWIELYNRGDAAQNLDGWFLTDSGTELTKWRFPAVSIAPGEYLTVFASERGDAVAGSPLHTTFKLDAGGEYLALVRPDGVAVKHGYAPSYPDQSADVSYGLSFEAQPGNNAAQYFTTPTPGAANIANMPEPTFSVTGRTFANAFTLALGPSEPGTQIRYTTNRTTPTTASTLYTGPITVNSSVVITARVFSTTGRAPGPVRGETYLALDASVQGFNSNLPVVVLDTFGSGVADNPQTLVGSVVLDTSAETGRAGMLDAPDFAGRAGLNVRGQSSAGFPKSQYHFELWDENNQDEAAPLLGMPSESDWVLYAPYSEKTLMQNALAYMWSNRIGQYAVRTRFVEVFMNTAAGNKIDYANDYRGVYILMEKIKVDADRVDIAKLDPTDNAGNAVTGGYLWAKDKPDPGEVGFSAGGNDYRFVEPTETEITPAQRTYLTNYLNEFNSVLSGPNFADPVNGYAKYIDVESFIDHHIIVELTKNIDGYRISTYYHKDRNGKIKMGPVWDYNLSLGNANYNTGENPTGWYHSTLGDYDYPYFRRLFQDPAFAQKYIDRWQQLRKDELSTTRLMGDIDALTSLLSDGNGNYPVGANPPQVANNPVVRNFKKWQILGQATWPNYYLDPSWINQVNWMKDWLRTRVQWWDNQYLAMPTITPAGGPVTGPTQVTISSSGSQTFVENTILGPGNPARAIVPTGDIGTGWRLRSGFDDAAWQAGSTGVGYDADPPGGGGDYTGDLGLVLEMRNLNPSAYIRLPFSVLNPGTVQSLILKMNYDDGFVAYLNGTEIARSSNVPADLAWNSGTVGNATHNAVGYEEFDISAFKHLLVPSSQGSNLLAIHALNAGAGSSDLLISPEILSRSVTTQPAPVYYTTDGSDPRLPNGAINPAAQLYTGPFTVSSTARVLARARTSNSRWSGLAGELFDFGENRLRVTELMYNPAPTEFSAYLPGDYEYVELQNTGTQPMNLNGYRFNNGISYTFGNYTLDAGARVLVVRNQAAFVSRYGAGRPIAGTYSGALSDGGERVRLVGRFGEVIHDFAYSDGWYSQTDGQGWSLTVVDPAGPLAAWDTKAGWRASDPVNGTPGADDAGLRPNSVVINEVMTNPSAGGDWIELRNLTGAAINLGNWWLSDNAANLRAWRIPAGTTLPANGYLVFNQSQFGGAFTLNPNGAGAYVSSGDAAGNLGGYRVDETFGPSDVDVTFGRHPTSVGADFSALVSATPGGSNAAPRVGPVVINEIMYSPDGTKAEYIELRNITAAPVQLFDPADTDDTWRFVGGIDWAFPTGVTIPANGYVLVVAVDPAVFRTQYNVPAGALVFGPYTQADGTNVLSDGGESVRLMRPGVNGPGARPYVQVDRVSYDDDAPWPAETSGTGQSLGRINPAAYGNDPVNWAAELFGGSPGRPNLDNTPPTADVVDVSPDPRPMPLASVNVVFSEAVTGFDLADLSLTRNGSAIPLAGATLSTADGGVTWTLGNLSNLTGAPGTYVLTVVASGSGIVDLGGRSLLGNASDTWVSDASAPGADIVDVTPDPRSAAVGTITIAFTEPVTGFDRADLELTRNNVPIALTASHPLASADGGMTWTLSGLAPVTGFEGQYVLVIRSMGTGIVDLAGNPLAGGAIEQWVVDATRPTATVTAVSPDPRLSPVDSMTVTFSESISGLDLADLRLSRDGGANLLTGAQTLTTLDGGDTWVLGNLAGLTAADGNYTLTLVSNNSGVADAAGNTLAADAAETWRVDVTAPVADVIDVSPDPHDQTGVDSVEIIFSEWVSGFDILDLRLTRDGGANLLTGAQTLTTEDGVTWTLGNLRDLTSGGGNFVLTLTSALSGIADSAGNALPADASDTFTVNEGETLSHEVYVSGSTWAPTFRDFVQSSGFGTSAYGYKLAATPTNADTVSWTNVNQIVLRYARPIGAVGVPSAGSIVVDGVRTDYTVTGVETLDDSTVRLTLDRPLGSAQGGGIVGDRVTLTVPGAGANGANFVQQINVLQGDANRDTAGRVNANDQGYVKSRLNRSTTSPTSPTQSSYTIFADVDASGRVNSNDQGAVKSRLNDNMPALAAAAGELATASPTDDLFASTPILA